MYSQFENDSETQNGAANASYVGDAGPNLLVGGPGNDRLDGGGGADRMYGGAGDDTYFIDNAADLIGENYNEGYDTALTAVDYALGAGVHVEVLGAIDNRSTAALRLVGNEFANTVVGNAGANLLVGGGGSDILAGLGGDDDYIVDDLSDLVQEGAGGGFDTVYTIGSYALSEGSHIERLTAHDQASAAALTLTGNSFANIILGNAGANLIVGGGGGDILVGFGGSDDYLVTDASDQVVENEGGGYDSVYALGSYTLGFNARVELLTAHNQAGTAALTLIGNQYANTIYGNAGANFIVGGGGGDIMAGFGGNDDYLVAEARDQVIETEGGGYDSVYALGSYTLGFSSHIELLTAHDQAGTAAMTLIGNQYANTVVGNAGANLLVGGGGSDRLVGLGGNDDYLVESQGEAVIESAGGGYDSVYTLGSYILGAGSEIERLIAHNQAGAEAINLIGNESANTIIGNAGSNFISGNGGNDVLIGRGGADVFAFLVAPGAANVDFIADFDPAADQIALGDVFAGLASGALGTGAFAVGQGATQADDRIIYNSATGALLFDADGVGGAASVQFATVTPGLALSASNILVLGAPNNLPTITSGATASVAENSAASTVVYTATSADADGDRVVFSLSGQHADRLSIDPVTGQVRLNSPADFETQNVYSFTVTAVDSSGLGSSRAVTLSISDVNEAPPAAPPYVVAETGASNDSSGTAQALNRDLFTVVSNTNFPDPSLPSAQINGNIAAGGDKDFFSVTLKAGELLILDVDGTTSLDSLLRVFGPNGLELVENDDQVSFDPGSTAHSGASHNMDSIIRFRAPTSGTYTYSVQSFADEAGKATSSGAYTINVSVGPPATAAQINEENIQALLGGSQWQTSNVTYSFTTSASQYGAGEGVDEKATGFEVLNSTQQTAVHQILTQMSGVMGLTFTQNGANPGAAQMRYAMSDDPDTAHAYYPGTGNGGDSWYNNNGPLKDDGTRGTPRYDNPVVGNYAYMTFLHETGHALGLKHGHESPALSYDRDSMEYSIMTYRGYIGASTGEDGGYKNETWGFAQTLMMYDIAALQRMYGANFNTHAGDTIYTWNPSTGQSLVNGAVFLTPGGNRVFMTVWDGGGNDTYNLSNYSTPVTIDLRPGEWTTTSAVQLANLGNGNMARGNVANALLHNGDARSLIENAVGGSGNDILIANQTVNQLTGGAGADTFRFMSLEDGGRGALADVLTDFLSGSDRIDLSALDANTNTAGDEAFAFIGTSAFSGVAGQLRYETVGNSVRIFADVNGDAVSDFELVVNSPVVAQPDFIL